MDPFLSATSERHPSVGGHPCVTSSFSSSVDLEDLDGPSSDLFYFLDVFRGTDAPWLSGVVVGASDPVPSVSLNIFWDFYAHLV